MLKEPIETSTQRRLYILKEQLFSLQINCKKNNYALNPVNVLFHTKKSKYLTFVNFGSLNGETVSLK
jgi:tmRNA-binding protein